MSRSFDPEDLQELLCRSVDAVIVYMYAMGEMNEDRAVSPLDR